jgi:hypothetical protein
VSFLSNIFDRFRGPVSDEDRHLEISDRLGDLVKKLKPLGEDDPVIGHTVASLSFLAILCGSEDKARLFLAASTIHRFASEALEQYAEPKPNPEEELRRLIEKGIDIACNALVRRDWTMATEGLAKLVFLDDLAKKVASGEEILKDHTQDEWADVIGDS